MTDPGRVVLCVRGRSAFETCIRRRLAPPIALKGCVARSHVRRRRHHVVASPGRSQLLTTKRKQHGSTRTFKWCESYCVPQYGDLPLTILRSVSMLSGGEYHDVEDEPLRQELERRGFEASNAAFLIVMRQLRGAGYLQCEFLGGIRGVSLVRLEEKGRIEVEGWPATPGSLSSSDVAELVASLEARGEDQTLAPEERSKARAAAGAIKDLGLSVTGGLILWWLKHMGVP